MNPAVTLQIFVNDAPREVVAGSTLDALMHELDLAARTGVAVAINGAVVPRTIWSTRELAAGDRVLVIRATQGG